MERDEILALADLNYWEALREQARRSGGTVVEEAGMLFTAGTQDHPVANTAARTDPRVDPADFVARAGAFYGERRHGYGVVAHDTAEDESFVDAAQRGGLVSMVTPAEMIVDRRLEERPLPSGCEIRRVTDPRGLADFAAVAGEAWSTYGIPPEVPRGLFSRPESIVAPHIVAVVAYLEGAASSSALTVLSHGIAGIYWVSTTSASRGRGLGEACTRAVTNVSFDMGARFVSLQASPMGDPIYRRMGYVEVGRYKLLLAPTPASR